MALYRHMFKGTHAAADPWQFGWYSNSSSSLSVVEAAAVNWLSNLMTGPAGGAGLASLVTAAIATTEVTTVEIDPVTGGQLTRQDAASVTTGTATGSSLPADVALVVSLRSATANRKGRGRFYLPSFAVSEVDTDGNVSGAAVATLLAALTFAWTGYSSVGAPTLYSRTDKQLRPITTFDVGNRWDTQRRRDDIASEARSSAVMP